MKQTGSRKALLNLALFLMFVSPVCASTEEVPDKESIEQVVSSLSSISWKQSSLTWQEQHPAASCENFHGNSYTTDADDEWGLACTDKQKLLTRQFFFYVDEHGEKLILQKVRFSIASDGLADSELLVKNLEQRLGKSTRTNDIEQTGSHFWSHIRSWHNPDQEVYVFSNHLGSDQTLLELIARDQSLVNAIKYERELLDQLRFSQANSPQQKLRIRLCEELGTDYPAVVSLLKLSESPSHAATFNALLTLLENAGSASPARRPILLLAADQLAENLSYAISDDSIERKKLAAYGLSFQDVHLAGGAIYASSLLWQVLKEYRNTLWGEHAFVLLLVKGWDRGLECEKGTDTFREVIRQGESFLDSHRETVFRAELFFILAQAHETAWSVSQAKYDEYVDSTQYQQEAHSARLKAIDYYTRLNVFAPLSVEGRYAALKLPQLKYGLDTNQRRYYCIYD